MLHLDMMKEAFLSRFVSYFTDGQDKYKHVHICIWKLTGGEECDVRKHQLGNDFLIKYQVISGKIIRVVWLTVQKSVI